VNTINTPGMQGGDTLIHQGKLYTVKDVWGNASYTVDEVSEAPINIIASSVGLNTRGVQTTNNRASLQRSGRGVSIV